jgi:hypothetical protein
MFDRFNRSCRALIVPLAALIAASGLHGDSAGRAEGPSAPRAAAGPARDGKVKASGITIAYESFGPEDREVILLIMGNGAQLTTWPAELIEELSAFAFSAQPGVSLDVGQLIGLTIANVLIVVYLVVAWTGGRRSVHDYVAATEVCPSMAKRDR